MQEKPETIRLVWDAIDSHGGVATSIQVRHFLRDVDKRWDNIGRFVVMMDRLVEDGYVTRDEGEINPRRGNRPDILYRRGGGLIEKLEQGHPAGLVSKAA